MAIYYVEQRNFFFDHKSLIRFTKNPFHNLWAWKFTDKWAFFYLIQYSLSISTVHMRPKKIRLEHFSKICRKNLRKCSKMPTLFGKFRKIPAFSEKFTIPLTFPRPLDGVEPPPPGPCGHWFHWYSIIQFWN